MITGTGATRIEALTGVRILAASAVFLSHVGMPASAPAVLATFASAGYNGVTLFFVLSGFVLAWNYVDRLAAPSVRSTWSFFVARFARVYPVYLVVLLVVMLPALLGPAPLAGAPLHFLALQTWHPDVTVAYAFNGPGWSIGVEFFLYAVFPLIVIGLARARSSVPVLLAIGSLAILMVFGLAWWFVASGRGDLSLLDPTSAHRWLYRTPVTRLGDFTVGIVAALLIGAARVRPWVGAIAQMLGAAAIVALMAYAPLLNSAWSWDAAYLLPAGLLLWGLAAAPSTALSRVLGSRPMVLMGTASFAFYLLHVPLLRMLGHQGAAQTWPEWATTTAVHFAVILVAAIGTHYAVELPAQRRIRRSLDPQRLTSRAEPLVAAPVVATR